MSEEILSFIIFCFYLAFLYGLYVFTKRPSKKARKEQSSWFYGLALPSSFCTGWTFITIFSVFIKKNYYLLSVYIGILTFTFLLPFFLERIYSIIRKLHCQDILSFTLKRYSDKKLVKYLLLTLISLVSIPYIALNLKILSLFFNSQLLFSPFFIIVIISLFFVILKLKQWNSIKMLSYQGIFISISILSLALICILFVESDFPIIFSTLKNNLKNSFSSKNFNHFFSDWNINMFLAAFAFIFLPRQFSTLSKQLHFTSKEKILKASLITACFVFILLLCLLGINLALYYYYVKEGSNLQFTNPSFFIFFKNTFGMIPYIFFVITAFAFIVSSLNQQFSVLADILTKHLKLKFVICLSIIFIAGTLLSLALKNIHSEKLVTICFLGIAQLAVPIVGALVWKKGNYKGASASLIVSLFIWIFFGWGAFLSDPSNFKTAEPFINIAWYNSLLKSYYLSSTLHYTGTTFFYSGFFSVIAYIVFSSFSPSKENNVTHVYLGKSFSFLSFESRFEKILKICNYDLNQIRLLSLFYSNPNLQFSSDELSAYYPSEKIQEELQNLSAKNVILLSSKKTYSLNIQVKEKYSLKSFFEAFTTIDKIFDKLNNKNNLSSSEIKTQLHQMENVYKIYLRLISVRSKKEFFNTIATILPSLYPKILKIDLVKNEKVKSLFLNPRIQPEFFNFKINFNSFYLDLQLSSDLDSNTLFIIEPIIVLSYKIIDYIHQLKKHTQKLQNLDSIRSNFLANISHELRTPLVPLKGYLALLLFHDKVKENKELSEITQAMQSSYKRLEKLIENLIVFKEITNESFSIQPIRILDFIYSCLNELKTKIDAKGILVNIKEEQIKDASIEADRDKLKLSFIQILDNAIKFNKKGGEISISFKEYDKYVLFLIKDSGIGIKKQSKEQVFETFFQEDSSDTRYYDGTGLGLSLAKKIISLHGGKIKLYSKESKGTIVKIKLLKQFIK